jgi:hypothetical protein
MIRLDRHGGATVVSVCVLLLGAAAAWGQSGRTGLRPPGSLSNPGRLQNIGVGSSYNLRSYSTGVGSLGRPSSGAGTSVLRSSISSGSGYTIRRSGGGSGPAGAGLSVGLPGERPQKGIRYNVRDLQVRSVGGSRGYGLGSRAPDTLAAAAFLDAVGGEPDTVIDPNSTEPLTSLASDGEDEYSQTMREGERLLREQQFRRAFEQFRIASIMGEKEPESALNMAHARIGMSRRSWASAAWYIREALRRLPELPMIRMKVRAMFPSNTVFEEKVEQLDAHLGRVPEDAEGWLVMAYLRWFDGEYDAARRALQQARAAATKDAMIEDVEKFYTGMVATGKVSGPLVKEADAQPES